MTTFIRKNHFPGQALIAYRVTPVFRWGWLGLFFRPKVRVDWGVALCSPEDTFDEELGCDLAEQRLDAYIDGRERIAKRGFAGTFYFPWKDYVEMERQGSVASCVLQVFEEVPLVYVPKRWAKLVN